MLMLLLSLAARADDPTEATAAAPPAAPSTPAETAAAATVETAAATPIEIDTINLTGDVPVPEVIIFTPRITIQEDSAQTLSARIDAQLAEAAKQR